MTTQPAQSRPAPFHSGEIFAVFRTGRPVPLDQGYTFDPVKLRDQLRAIRIDVADVPFHKEKEAAVIYADDGSTYVAVRVVLAAPGHEAVLRAVDTWQRVRDRQRVDVDDALLIEMSPTWLTGAAQDWSDGGGPGGRPQPGGRRHFRPGKTDVYNGDPALIQAEYARVTGEVTAAALEADGVRVAILDTWPMGPNPDRGGQVDHVGRILTFVLNNGITPADHPLLVAAGRDALIDRFDDLHPDPAIPYRLVNWERLEFEPQYDKSDHGLFVAGIVRDIAPRARIRVFRVLNDNGGGDVGDIFTALGAITREIHQARARDERLCYVVNLSFGFLAPLRMIPILINRGSMSEREQIEAFASTANPDSPEVDLRILTAERLLRTALTPAGVLRVAEWLPDLGPIAQGLVATVALFEVLVKFPEILLVAAAGNDSDRPNDRIFQPRVPAALEGILGVSATRTPSVFATFSNRDDIELSRDDGIAAFGGERVFNGDVYDTDEGVHGAAVAPQLPPPLPGHASSANTTGWARWAGTSFAAPTVAGFAACLWGTNCAWEGQQVLRLLVSPATGPRNENLLTQQ